MNDITLLVLLGNRETHDRFAPLVKDHVVSSTVNDIQRVLPEYYAAYPSKTEVNWEEFETFFFMVKGKVKPEKATTYRQILANCAEKHKVIAGLPTAELPEFYRDVYQHYVKLDYISKVSELAFTHSGKLISGEDQIFDDIKKLLDDCDKELVRVKDDSSLFVSTKLEDVLVAVTEPGFEWPLEELNVSLGPLRKGDHVIIGAYVETGKSTMAAQITANALPQLKPEDGPIFYVNNDQRSAVVMERIIQSYFGATQEQLELNKAAYSKEFDDKYKGRLLLLEDDAGHNSVGKLNKLFREYKPSLIIFDMLDKVHIYGDYDRDDLRIANLYRWARDVSRKCAVISITQVDATGSSAKYIDMNQLRGSKVDKPAEADAIITIGRSVDLSKPYDRHIFVPKNKLHGGPRTKETARHGFFDVRIKPAIARYEGDMKK